MFPKSEEFVSTQKNFLSQVREANSRAADHAAGPVDAREHRLAPWRGAVLPSEATLRTRTTDFDVKLHAPTREDGSLNYRAGRVVFGGGPTTAPGEVGEVPGLTEAQLASLLAEINEISWAELGNSWYENCRSSREVVCNKM